MGIQCKEHGEQEETFVCQHLARSLQTLQSVGLWSVGPRSDAWCDACEYVRITEGGTSGEWNERSESFADVTVLCGVCHDKVRVINRSRRPTFP